MRRRGRIVAIDNGRATVCFELRDACDKCDARAMCQAAGSKHTVYASNSENGKIGDEVYVEQAPARVLLSAFLLFGLPILLAVTGLIIGTRWGDTWSVLCGISGFVLGLFIAKIINNLLARKSLFLPRIIEVVKKEGA